MTSETNSGIFGVVLAAGSGSRFGSTKQLALIAGEALIHRATNRVADVFGNRSVLVVGHDWNAVLEACGNWPGFLLRNEAYDAGLGVSLSLAVQSIRHVASAVVVTLADQPLITSAHIAAVANTWSGDPGEIVATEFGGDRGAPALLPRNCFDELAALRGNRGARSLFDSPHYSVRTIRCEDAAIDIDTADDLLNLGHTARN